jgi:NADPH:quinone reductase-like Zn-dependent oxidoreductase
MKTWTIQQHGAVDGLALNEVPEPLPAPGEVLVRVRAVSLNYRDLTTLHAARPGMAPVRLWRWARA